MQPASAPETETVRYQVPRNTLVRIWWRRWVLRPRFLLPAVAVAAGSVLLLTLPGGGMGYIGIGGLVILAVMPITVYYNLARTIDGNAQWTDLKTLEFGPARLVVSGPDWKSELPWTYFKGFSEDETYFYLHLAQSGLASVIPKDSFSSAQQERFRHYAQTRNV